MNNKLAYGLLLNIIIILLGNQVEASPVCK
jgi:hypothetical protein